MTRYVEMEADPNPPQPAYKTEHLKLLPFRGELAGGSSQPSISVHPEWLFVTLAHRLFLFHRTPNVVNGHELAKNAQSQSSASSAAQLDLPLYAPTLITAL